MHISVVTPYFPGVLRRVSIEVSTQSELSTTKRLQDIIIQDFYQLHLSSKVAIKQSATSDLQM